MNSKMLMSACGWLAVCTMGLACNSTPTHQDLMTFIKAKDHVAAGSSYRLAPPDLLRIHSPQASEIDTITRIRPDGTVHLRLLGDVRLAGLTDREAAAKLQNELQVYYREPIVNITVAQATNNVFYLFGEITGRGDRGGAVHSLTGRDTLLNVLTTYPPTQNAWLSQIKVIRPNPEDAEQNQEMKINFHKMIATGDLQQNILLQEGDIVYVPPTPMAWLGYRIRELLSPVSPVIEAYQTPDRLMEAGDVYDDNDDDGGGNNNNGAAQLLGTIQIP